MNLIWDFDGVILDSMPIREEGFREVLANHPVDQVEKLIEYHLANGGYSRYVKFRYFYEQIMGEPVTEERVNELAEEFSKIMLRKLKNPDLIIQESMAFIESASKTWPMHIASGSDGKELNELCRVHGIEHHFLTIDGSPMMKTNIIENVLANYNYDKFETALIGDSKNDYDAAMANGIRFYGYNNESLKLLENDTTVAYLDSYDQLTTLLSV